MPNPASNNVNISWSPGILNEANLRIYDLTGKEVMSRTLNANEYDHGSLTLDISPLNEGMYVVNLVSGNTFVSEKLIVR
jgi:hypothetical protein